MAPKPSRNLLSVTKRDGSDGRGHLAFLTADGKDVPAQFVRYSERSEAWNLAFHHPKPTMPSTWASANAILTDMVEVDDRGPLTAYSGGHGEAARAKYDSPEDTEQGNEGSVPTVEVKPAAGSIDAIIAGQIEAAIAAGKAGVDDAQVRAIVEEFADNLAPKVTQIVYRDREPIELEGTTHPVLPKVLALVNKGKLPWLVGPAGTGKSTLARQVAQTLGIQFRSIGCSPMMSTAAIYGYMDAQGRYVSTDFRRCYEDGGVFLLDEIDAAHPGVLTALNDALANGTASFPDTQTKRHPDFVCIVAANTYGRGADRQYVGRNQLDAATVNRFKMIEVGYSADLEDQLARAHNPGKADGWLRIVRKIRDNAIANGIQVVVSTRSVMDCDLLDDFTVEEVLEMSIFQGIADSQRDKLLAGVNTAI